MTTTAATAALEITRRTDRPCPEYDIVDNGGGLFTWDNGQVMRAVDLVEFDQDDYRVRAIPQTKTGRDYKGHNGVWLALDALPDGFATALFRAMLPAPAAIEATPAGGLDPRDFPAVDGRPVTEAHALICRERGHATHTVSGVDAGVCPRCGEVTTPAPSVAPADADARRQQWAASLTDEELREEHRNEHARPIVLGTAVRDEMDRRTAAAAVSWLPVATPAQLAARDCQNNTTCCVEAPHDAHGDGCADSAHAHAHGCGCDCGCGDEPVAAGPVANPYAAEADLHPYIVVVLNLGTHRTTRPIVRAASPQDAAAAKRRPGVLVEAVLEPGAGACGNLLAAPAQAPVGLQGHILDPVAVAAASTAVLRGTCADLTAAVQRGGDRDTLAVHLVNLDAVITELHRRRTTAAS